MVRLRHPQRWCSRKRKKISRYRNRNILCPSGIVGPLYRDMECNYPLRRLLLRLLWGVAIESLLGDYGLIFYNAHRSETNLWARANELSDSIDR